MPLFQRVALDLADVSHALLGDVVLCLLGEEATGTLTNLHETQVFLYQSCASSSLTFRLGLRICLCNCQELFDLLVNRLWEIRHLTVISRQQMSLQLLYLLIKLA